MHQFFLICATIGGTILVLRLGLSVLGLGLDHADADLGGLEDSGHDFVSDQPADGHHPHSGHLGRIFTFQAIVSFLAFFGVGGLSALEARQGPTVSVLIGTATGFAAVFLLGYALRSLRRLHGDGTVRLERSVGLSGTVYLRIPGSGTGDGKVTLPIQGRTVEVKARTPGPELRQGEPVVVTGVVDDQTVEVASPAAAVLKTVSLAE